MKKFWKILAAVIAAIILLSIGYALGSRAGENSITSALPHFGINHENPNASPDAPPPNESEKPKENKTEQKDSQKTSTVNTEPEKTGRTVVKTSSSASQTGWTKLDFYNGDLQNNGSNCAITLYTSAQTDDGEVLWDDGQNWVVEISDNNGGYYTLLEKYIQNGTVYFEVDKLENGKTAVTVFTKTAAGLDVKQYTYSDGGFAETALYNSSTQNTLYSSLPDYN